jgi:beta-fructofuranosidase
MSKRAAGLLVGCLATAAGLVAAQGEQPPRQRETDILHQKAVAAANSAVAQAWSRAENDPNRPTYHFQAPALWMNDPNGPIYYQGEYHLFYQHNPYGVEWGHMHWGHAKSADLVHWEHLSIALAPSVDQGEEHCFSGSAILHNGVPTIFYTSIGPKTPAGDGAVQWMATSPDGMRTWDKSPANPVLTGALHKGLVIKDWRDPFIWKTQDGYYLVLGGHREGGKGCVGLYQSQDLKTWTFLNILYEGTDANWECPNFFQLGDKWVLVVSPHAAVKYFIGSLGADHRFRPESSGLLDLSPSYYAPNSLVDGMGRRLMWGWVRDVRDDGWNGALTLPRVLTLRSDGRLGMEPVPELQMLRGEHHHRENLLVTPTSTGLLPNIKGDCLEIVAVYEPGDAQTLGLTVRRSADGKEVTTIQWDREHQQLTAGRAQGSFKLLASEKTLTLHVFLDKCLLEVYANGRACITSPVSAKPDSLGLDLFARGGSARLKSLDVWQMKPNRGAAETSAGWFKSPANPVLGGKLGTCFDVSVLKEDGKYRMWFSWRPRKSIAMVESRDGVHWSEPVIVLGPNSETDWEADVNRPVVLERDGVYHMWYTGQAKGHSWIGQAMSTDGRKWERLYLSPVLSPEQPWEKVAVMCPHVLWDERTERWRMWYSGGEQNEPNAIGYATSADGRNWTKAEANPIFRPDPNFAWEKDRVTGCQVLPHQGGYLMFYIGFRDEAHAQIGAAWSRNGVTGWRRHPANPIIRSGKDRWDQDAVYKPYALFDGKRWQLWYNGRRGGSEQIGLAVHEGANLGF